VPVPKEDFLLHKVSNTSRQLVAKLVEHGQSILAAYTSSLSRKEPIPTMSRPVVDVDVDVVRVVLAEDAVDDMDTLAVVVVVALAVME
jgi:hypothetical protein